MSVAYQRRNARSLARPEPAWGAWSVPERSLGVLGDVAGLRILEVGCGGGQGAVAWSRVGAVVTALDLSPAQLAHARALPGADAVRFVEGDAESLPFEAGSFDVVLSDHGALTFANPVAALPEVARVLAPGGRVAFLMTSPWLEVCWDEHKNAVVEALKRPYFSLGRMETPEEGWYSLTYGGQLRALRAAGFTVEDIVEVQAPPGAATTFESFPAPAWARRWPAELIWKASLPPG